MGKYRGGQKPWEKDDPKGRRLDPGQYPELNAVFYTADPAEFIKMRTESLSLMACSDDQLAPLYGSDRVIGTAPFGPMPPPGPDPRQRYIRMEAVMIANHASEALLRLFFAHVEHPECPWLGMSASNDFAEYKAKLAAALNNGFDREQIATVFLGGVNRVDSCIQLTDAEFEDAIDSLAMLLIDCANRVLGDAFVYNAVKHGVSAVAVDDAEAKVAWQPTNGEPVILHEGPTHVYLHKKASPNAARDEAHWWLTMEDSNPGRELSVSVLITYALDSLWSVARRRYLGESGTINYVSNAAVEMAIYGATMRAMNHLKRAAHELIKLKPDGSVDGTIHHVAGYHIPREWSISAAAAGSEVRSVALPARQRDRRLYSTSGRAYLPITPRGFERG
ncbi:hypothetical protein [Mycobacterium arosiense]|jgi:hypothetical protein|uniref:Uncharacterized protein n=1 Tax=Mycobacterium arosiense ATCC BAA-1401 = DSM 45069 TaxID=1265311 RepID=A0A1W9Z8G0_MYCAI|nr:hypothetical protein [Mycobacterium arosiense]ORA09107.1 hypothetical protein BST14_22660 [Mycobacterium arosiense ATCC BAA-1401 = DSM 45069]